MIRKFEGLQRLLVIKKRKKYVYCPVISQIVFLSIDKFWENKIVYSIKYWHNLL